MQQDCERALRRSVDHRPKAQAVGLDHVLAGSHLMLLWIKSAATSSAWSSTLSSPWPWPLKISSRALGMSLIFSLSSARSANGSLSPLRKSVGQRISLQCAVLSWSLNPGRKKISRTIDVRGGHRVSQHLVWRCDSWWPPQRQRTRREKADHFRHPPTSRSSHHRGSAAKPVGLQRRYV